MRFTAASIAFFAGLAAALPGDVQTVYETQDVTITSCAPSVTNCPARSTSTPSGADAVTNSSAAPTASETPVETPVETPSASSASSSSVPVIPAPSNTAVAPSVSVIAVTTCVPTVTYITVPVSTPSGAAGAHTSVPVIPSAPTGTPSPSATPSIPPGGLSTGAGNTLSGSFVFAGAAAVAALFLA